ncbi:hypothetical protein MLD38_004475 [Melastoma candidum]|uniref:Uncharacterized protein n=1 Tax=Melastoma candidum TaxID=119954 RepID=A0ACB9S5H8_9MYRT|nr:hypothetical protein MLD38_004475 [Melastoma candidum]
MASSAAQVDQNQPPLGYPTADPPAATLPGKKNKKRFFARTKPRGERGFIEGCLFALCCCWLCEECCCL